MAGKSPQSRILLLDVGNSAVKAAWSDGDRLLTTRRYRIRVPGNIPQAAGNILSHDPFDRILFMSVNPSHSARILEILRPRCPAPVEVGKDIPRGIRIEADEPELVGTDRTTTALAAYEIYRNALIVVDFGTAITFDCVSPDGAFLGGLICPGLSMAASALERDTAFLPAVEVSPRKGLLAKNTEEAIISGIYHGVVEATNGILKGLMPELGGNVPVVATGGDAEIIAPACPAIKEVRVDLSLEGLLMLYRRTAEPANPPQPPFDRGGTPNETPFGTVPSRAKDTMAPVSGSNRVDRIRELFPEHGLDSLLISRPSDVRYLSGFTGEGCLLVLPGDVRILTDSRYTEQAQNEVPEAAVMDTKGKIVDALAGLEDKPGRLGLDSSHLTYNVFAEISGRLKIRPVPLKNPVSPLRAVKDDRELDLIRRCVAIAQDAFGELKKTIRPGMTEKEVADEIEYLIRRLGGSSSSFPTIAASAANASLPHHTVSDRVIEPGDAVLIDWGASLSGYKSDTTRMLFLGEPSSEHRKVYAAVLEAQRLGLEALAPGRSGVEVDGAARSCLEGHGVGDYFAHGLGHGIGMEVHEAPGLSRRSEDILKEGMVVTIEPGVYKPQWGGIRIEDMAVVTAKGCELITSLSKDIEASIVGGPVSRK